MFRHISALAIVLTASVSFAQDSDPRALAIAERDKMPTRFVEYSSPYLPRMDFGARLEPAQGIIHGAGQDPGSYLEYSALFAEEHRPLMQMTYVPLTEGVEPVRAWQRSIAQSLKDLQDQPTTLQIGLNMTMGNDDGTGAAGQVAAGQHDKAVAALVDALKTLDVPTYLRIGYEFEGEWNNYTPTGYVGAFKRITDAIRAAGLEHVATVWCAAGGSAGFIGNDELMSYYPGDDYADWWGVDIFSPEEIPHPWLGQFYALAQQHRKPVMIGENTPRYVGADKGWHSWYRWYKPFFEMVRQYPQIKAISYINWDWVYWSNTLGFQWHDWEDARLKQNDLVTELYKLEMSNPAWLHSGDIHKLTNSREQ